MITKSGDCDHPRFQTGGALHLEPTDTSLTVVANSTFERTTASVQGGAIYAVLGCVANGNKKGWCDAVTNE